MTIHEDDQAVTVYEKAIKAIKGAMEWDDFILHLWKRHKEGKDSPQEKEELNRRLKQAYLSIPTQMFLKKSKDAYGTLIFKHGDDVCLTVKTVIENGKRYYDPVLHPLRSGSYTLLLPSRDENGYPIKDEYDFIQYGPNIKQII